MNELKKDELKKKNEFKLPLPLELRDDLKRLAFLDGVTLKGKVTMLLKTEVEGREEELKELSELNQRRKSREQ